MFENMCNVLKFIGIDNIINAISVIIVAFGGSLGYRQWKQAKAIKRADYLNTLVEKIRTDKDIGEMIYILDYNPNWYSPSFHNSGEFERKMDKTLSYFSYICYLYKQKLIKKQEFEFLRYSIERILMNRSTVNYFYNIYHFASKYTVPTTFKCLFEYGQDKGMFRESFYDPQSKEYPHYLNF